MSTPGCPASRTRWRRRSSSTICRARRATPCRRPARAWRWGSPTGWIRWSGLFAVGLAPTSTADPFGLRRDALGLVQALAGAGQPFDLRPALQAAARNCCRAGLPEAVLADVLTLSATGSTAGCAIQGLPHDVVSRRAGRAGLDPCRGNRRRPRPGRAGQGARLDRRLHRLRALQAHRAQPARDLPAGAGALHRRSDTAAVRGVGRRQRAAEWRGTSAAVAGLAR